MKNKETGVLWKTPLLATIIQRQETGKSKASEENIYPVRKVSLKH
jgi:hypothetical protein